MPVQHKGDDVAPAIAAMAAAVKCGDFQGAEALGAAASYPLAIPKHALQPGRTLFNGPAATVYEALYTLPGGGAPVPVAVKRVKVRQDEDLPRFRNEVGLLAQLQHPGLVTLVGARMLPPDYMLVMAQEPTNAAHELHSAGWRPCWGGALRVAAQLARALAHLHAHGVVHRDVKPSNLLMDVRREQAKLTDFGLAVPVGSSAPLACGRAKMHKQALVGTLEYLAPEVLLGGQHAPAADVYALGITLAELGTGIYPFSDCTRDVPLDCTVLEMGFGRQELAAAVAAAKGLRPTLLPSTPATVRELLEACWHRDPARRPTAAAAAARMAELAALLVEDVPTSPHPQTNQAVINRMSFDDELQQQQGQGQQGAGQAGRGVTTGPAPMGPVTLGSRLCPDAQLAGTAAADRLRWGTAPPAWLQAAQSSLQNLLGCAAALELAVPAVGGYASAGARGAERMEDRHVILRSLGGWQGVTVFGVFDGHRGAEAAAYLATHLEGHLAARWHSARSAGELLAGALADADAAFCAQQEAEWAQRVAAAGPAAAGRRPFPGSTATVALVAGGLLAVASLGHSRAVLCRDGQGLALSQDHTGAREDERARVLNAGGTVLRAGETWRVGQAGLQITRSVGDADLKGEGVTAEAEVTEIALTCQDTYLVMAVGGVWDKLSNDHAMRLVSSTVKQPCMCAQRLVTEAANRGASSNLTAVVALLPGGGEFRTMEQVFQGAGRRRGEGGLLAMPSGVAADEAMDTY